MRSNYKKLGPYIQEVNRKNTNLSVTKLRGVSVSKEFIPSIANIIGTNMSTYKIVSRRQFAYGPVTSRNSDKLSVALLNEEECIISTSYTVFEVTDQNALLPEYLMMWFRRPEFDRYARFMSHGSVRELFGWEEMCDVELPIPSIERQQEIAKEYSSIVERIRINEQLIHKLGELGQTIYKRWFVDFDFPISAKYAAIIGKPELEGQPYKSKGGEMAYNDVLKGKIPKGWRDTSIGTLVKCNDENYNNKDPFDKLLYLDTGSVTDNKFGEWQELRVGIDPIPSRAQRKVKNDSIVYSTIRPNLRHVGIIKKHLPNMVVSTGFAVLNPNPETICPELIYIWLTRDTVVEYLQSKAEMSVSTYPSIKPEDLLNIVVAYPYKEDELLMKAKLLFSTKFEVEAVFNEDNYLSTRLSEIFHQRLSTESEIK